MKGSLWPPFIFMLDARVSKKSDTSGQALSKDSKKEFIPVSVLFSSIDLKTAIGTPRPSIIQQLQVIGS